MLENGIAPRQAFTCRIAKPTYTTDYWGEHDVEYEPAEIIWVEPVSHEMEALLWFGWFKDLEYQEIVMMRP